MDVWEGVQRSVFHPDTLPYVVYEALTGNPVSVTFQKTDARDSAELQAEPWSTCVYADVWPSYTTDARTLKLIVQADTASHIQGMVRPGEVAFGGKFLRDSLLEANPDNRRSAHNRHLRGVGRVLVARLVVKSLVVGQQGRVLVSLGVSTEPQFYLSLGFRKQGLSRRLYALFETEAQALLRSVLHG